MSKKEKPVTVQWYCIDCEKKFNAAPGSSALCPICIKRSVRMDEILPSGGWRAAA